MFDVLLARWKQGHRTMRYPAGPPPELPERFAGRPTIDAAKCQEECRQCVAVCPTGAIGLRPKRTRRATRHGTVPVLPPVRNRLRRGRNRVYARLSMAASRRDDLMVRDAAAAGGRHPGRGAPAGCSGGRSNFARSAPAAAMPAKPTPMYWERWRGTWAASASNSSLRRVMPMGLLITGPVTENMRLALQKTYEAVPWPKLVIAVGACAISGGPYVDHPEVHNGAAACCRSIYSFPAVRRTR